MRYSNKHKYTLLTTKAKGCFHSNATEEPFQASNIEFYVNILDLTS